MEMIKKISLFLAVGLLSLSSTTPLVTAASEVTPSPQTKSTSSTPSKSLPSTLLPSSSSKGSEPQALAFVSTSQSQSTSREPIVSSQTVGTNTHKKEPTSQARESPASNLAADIASGTNGTVAWNIDAAGTLHLGAGTLADNTSTFSPWVLYKSIIKTISFEGMVTAPTNSRSLFSGLYCLKEIEGISSFDTSNVINMSSMFQGCKALVSLNLSSFNTSKVTNMSSMFYSCLTLSSLDLSSFDTSNVTNMSAMFYSCLTLSSLDLSSFDTSKVTTMSNMFAICNRLTDVNVTSFDTSNVTDMYSMFFSCLNLTSLDLSSFDTIKTSSLPNLLANCPIHKIRLSSKIRLTSNANLTSVPNNSSYTGKWQTMGTGTEEYPNGAWSGDTSALITRSESGVADTYVWQPVRVPAADVTVKYVDTDGNTIHASQTISGNVGDAYDATTATYKLTIDGYTLDASQFPTNGTGTLSATAQTVTYVYTKNPVPAADVTVKYVDTAGNTIHASQTISGNVGDTYDATTATYKLAIDGYTLDASQLPTNGTGTLSATAQTVTYVYTKNKNTFPSLPMHQDNPPRHNSFPQTFGVNHHIPKVTAASEELPETGDNKMQSHLALGLGILSLISTLAVYIKKVNK